MWFIECNFSAKFPTFRNNFLPSSKVLRELFMLSGLLPYDEPQTEKKKEEDAFSMPQQISAAASPDMHTWRRKKMYFINMVLPSSQNIIAASNRAPPKIIKTTKPKRWLTSEKCSRQPQPLPYIANELVLWTKWVREREREREKKERAKEQDREREREKDKLFC
jgi:hypothetical protein